MNTNYNITGKKGRAKIYSNPQTLLFDIFAWVITVNFFVVLKIWGNTNQYDYVILSQVNSIFWAHLHATVTGIVIGTILSFVDYKRSTLFHRLGFGKIILIKSLTYFFTIVIIVLLFTFIFTLFLGPGPLETFNKIINFTNDMLFANMILYCAGVSFLVSFIKQLDKKFGPGNLIKMITGKYHQPVAEERIFLFLDLKDSTGIAERLGHIKYSQLLQDCFSDISKIIRDYQAEIYQYVGDEVVLTWPANRGFKNNNCIRLFFEFQKIIKNRSSYYIENYKCIPEFKGGMHYGMVTTVEIGDVKKEIVFHGDVLNTSSRIQNLCKKYQRDLLVSGCMITRMPSCDHLTSYYIDSVVPRGKSETIEIHCVKNNPETKASANRSKKIIFLKKVA